MEIDARSHLLLAAGLSAFSCRLKTLSLTELEPGPRSALPVLLAFLHAGIPRDEPLLLQLLSQLGVVVGQRARDAVPDGARLSRRPAAGHRHVDVEALRRLRREEGLLDHHLEDVVREVVVEGTLVDRDLA